MARYDPPPQNVLQDMDPDTAELILRLQLADIQDLEASAKDKQKEAATSIAQTAYRAMADDLRNTQSLSADQRMARSMSRAAIADGNAVAQYRREEASARADRALALRLGGTQLESSRWATSFSNSGTQLESSRWAASRSNRGAGVGATRPCIACQEGTRTSNLITAPCHHDYCRDCVISLFSTSFTEESLFPPRCCRQNIPLETAAIFLTRKMQREYSDKTVEFGTTNRTYCSRPDCSAFITPTNIHNQTAHCTRCRARTCTVCKGAAHLGQDCPEDENHQAVLNLAEQQGWRSCHSCHRMVELDTGCFHMTCLCHAQFCYLCGARWKTCDCPQWDENCLLHRAELLVRREQPEVADDDNNLAAQVRQMAEDLREDHNCDHERWEWVSGRYDCEECHDTLPQYIFQCRQCLLRACNRCRRNRL